VSIGHWQKIITACLLRCHVRKSASEFLSTEHVRRIGKEGQPKITENQGSIRIQQDIFWLNVAVDDVLVMSILQSRGDLLDVVYYDM